MSENQPRPPQNRIPGTTPLKEQHSKDLKKLSYNELLEIRERQSKFLSFKKRLQQLPDKGKRLQESYDKLLDEIKRRDEVEAAAIMFSELNIAAKGKSALNNLEWHGRMGNTNDDSHVDDLLDSDDELELDPLRIIAQRRMHERQTKVLPPPASLITAADLDEIAAFKKELDSPDSALTGQSETSSEINSSLPTIAADQIEIDMGKLQLNKSSQEPPLDQHSLYLIDKTESNRSELREKFKPYRTTVSNVHDPAKERVRKKGKHWEITAATPPLIQHKQMQLVPLAESASLQADYMNKVQEQRVQQAEARLAKQEAILKSKSSRNPNVDHLIEGKQRAVEFLNEVHDPAAVEQAASGINYTVYN